MQILQILQILQNVFLQQYYNLYLYNNQNFQIFRNIKLKESDLFISIVFENYLCYYETFCNKNYRGVHFQDLFFYTHFECSYK